MSGVSGAGGPGRGDRGPLRRLLSPSASAFQTLFETVYLALGVGLSAAAAGFLPLAAAFITLARPLEAWPFLLVCALPVGPAFAAAFAVLGAAKTASDVAPFRDYFRAWRSLALPSLAVWTGFIALAGVLVVDIGVIWGSPFAALIGPVTVVVGAIAAAGTLHAIALLAAPARDGDRDVGRTGERTGARPLGPVAAAKAGLFLAVRRPVLSLLSLVVVAVWAMVVLAQPALGLLALTGFALLVLQANSAAAAAAVATVVSSEG